MPSAAEACAVLLRFRGREEGRARPLTPKTKTTAIAGRERGSRRDPRRTRLGRFPSARLFACSVPLDGLHHAATSNPSAAAMSWWPIPGRLGELADDAPTGARRARACRCAARPGRRRRAAPPSPSARASLDDARSGASFEGDVDPYGRVHYDEQRRVARERPADDDLLLIAAAQLRRRAGRRRSRRSGAARDEALRRLRPRRAAETTPNRESRSRIGKVRFSCTPERRDETARVTVLRHVADAAPERGVHPARVQAARRRARIRPASGRMKPATTSAIVVVPDPRSPKSPRHSPTRILEGWRPRSSPTTSGSESGDAEARRRLGRPGHPPPWSARVPPTLQPSRRRAGRGRAPQRAS